MNSRTRFSVLARDNFTCIYCGRRPPDVALEIDHAISLNNGGNDTINNYVTSCEDCNKGKSSSNHIIEFDTWLDRTIYLIVRYGQYGCLLNTLNESRRIIKDEIEQLIGANLPGTRLVHDTTGEEFIGKDTCSVIDDDTGEIVPTRFDKKEGR